MTFAEKQMQLKIIIMQKKFQRKMKTIFVLYVEPRFKVRYIWGRSSQN